MQSIIYAKNTQETLKIYKK